MYVAVIGNEYVPESAMIGVNCTEQLPAESLQLTGLKVPDMSPPSEKVTEPVGMLVAFARSVTVTVHFVVAGNTKVDGLQVTVVEVESKFVRVNPIVPLRSV